MGLKEIARSHNDPELCKKDSVTISCLGRCFPKTRENIDNDKLLDEDMHRRVFLEHLRGQLAHGSRYQTVKDKVSSVMGVCHDRLKNVEKLSTLHLDENMPSKSSARDYLVILEVLEIKISPLEKGY